MTDTPIVPWHCDICERDGCALCRGNRDAYASSAPHACAGGPTDTPIEPALTAEEWADGYVSVDIEAHPARVSVLGTPRLHLTAKRTPLGGMGGDPRDFPALIALANAALPDDDPRKITRARLDYIREVARAQAVGPHDIIARHMCGFADALESYLPPE